MVRWWVETTNPFCDSTSLAAPIAAPLVDTVTELADRGIGFRSLQEAIDTTPAAKVVFHVFAALTEFERRS